MSRIAPLKCHSIVVSSASKELSQILSFGDREEWPEIASPVQHHFYGHLESPVSKPVLVILYDPERCSSRADIPSALEMVWLPVGSHRDLDSQLVLVDLADGPQTEMIF
jgi:hypothetical protein